jgi:hypothetical protein
MRTTRILPIIAILLLGASGLGLGASREEQMITRVDTVTVVLKGRTITIQAIGMCRSPSAMNRAGRLVRKGAQPVLNKDGLLEYNFVFNGVPGYTGFKLHPVKANLHERSLPVGVRGVRIFSQFNEADGLLPEKKKSKPIFSFGKKGSKSSEETGSSGGTPRP